MFRLCIDWRLLPVMSGLLGILFCFTSINSVLATSLEYVIKHKRDALNASSAAEIKKANARYNAAVRFTKGYVCQAKKLPQTFYSNKRKYEAEIDSLISQQPNQKALNQALVIRGELRFFSKKLEEFIFFCKWKLGNKKEATKAARSFLISSESALAHKILMYKALEADDDRLAVFHRKKAQLGIFDSLKTACLILTIKFKRLLFQPILLGILILSIISCFAIAVVKLGPKLIWAVKESKEFLGAIRQRQTKTNKKKLQCKQKKDKPDLSSREGVRSLG